VREGAPRLRRRASLGLTRHVILRNWPRSMSPSIALDSLSGLGRSSNLASHALDCDGHVPGRRREAAGILANHGGDCAQRLYCNRGGGLTAGCAWDAHEQGRPLKVGGMARCSNSSTSPDHRKPRGCVIRFQLFRLPSTLEKLSYATYGEAKFLSKPAIAGPIGRSSNWPHVYALININRGQDKVNTVHWIFTKS